MRFASYLGCTARGSTPEVDTATRHLAERLGVELVDLDEGGCCGSCEVKAVNPKLHLLLNARLLALARERDLEILTVCDTCQLNLRQTQRELAGDPEKLEATNAGLRKIGLRFDGRAAPRHLAEVLWQEFGPERLRALVSRPLAGLRVAPFACCHAFRGGGDPANRSLLGDLLAACGAEVVPVRRDTHCCGFHVLMVNEDLAVGAAGRFLAACADAGVDCVATSSPLCHIALDLYQGGAERAAGRRFGLPVFHFQQLVALSLGVGAADLGLRRHLVATDAALRKIGG